MSTETNKTIDGAPILRRVGTFWPLIAAIAIYLVLGGAYVQRAIPRGATNFDSANYEAMTKQWLRTGVYGYWAATDPGKPDAVVTPGYPAFLSPFYYFSHQTAEGAGGPYAVIFYVQLLVGAVLLWLIWLYANMVATRRAANIAVLLLAPMYTFYNNAGAVLTSLVATTLVFGYFVVLGKAFERRSAWLAGVGGLLLALGLLTRPTLALAALVPLVLGFSTAIRASRRESLIALAGIVLPFVPWVIRNWISLGRPMLIQGRTDPILGGIDPYFRGAEGAQTLTHGPSLEQYGVVSQYNPTITPLQFAWRITSQNLSRSALEVIGWFTVGKIDYLAFANMPATATESAVDGILVSSVSALGFAGAVLAIRWRDLAPTAVMLVVWLAQNAIMVPDQRYWFDVLPFLATLAGALIAAAWGRAPIARRSAA